MSREQIMVAVGMGLGVALTLALFLSANAGAFALPEAWGADRWRLAAGCAFVAALALALQVAEIAAQRFFSTQDISGAGLTEATPKNKMLRAILQNTLEQVVLASIVYAAFAASAPDHWLALLPICAGLFLFGRLLFRFGYAHGAAWRGPGFGLGFYPTMGLALMVLIFWIA